MTVQYDLETITDEESQRGQVKDPTTEKYFPDLVQAHPHLTEPANEGSGQAAFSTSPASDGTRETEVRNEIIASGNSFVASKARRKALRRRFKADGVEMEGATVAQVCYQQRTPFIVIRSLSDHADQQARSTLQHYEKVAAQNAQQLVREIVKLLPAEVVAADDQESAARATASGAEKNRSTL